MTDQESNSSSQIIRRGVEKDSKSGSVTCKFDFHGLRLKARSYDDRRGSLHHILPTETFQDTSSKNALSAADIVELVRFLEDAQNHGNRRTMRVCRFTHASKPLKALASTLDAAKSIAASYENCGFVVCTKLPDPVWLGYLVDAALSSRQRWSVSLLLDDAPPVEALRASLSLLDQLLAGSSMCSAELIYLLKKGVNSKIDYMMNVVGMFASGEHSTLLKYASSPHPDNGQSQAKLLSRFQKLLAVNKVGAELVNPNELGHLFSADHARA